MQVTKKTTKAALQGKVGGKVYDHSLSPGFTVVYPHLDASFTLSKDRSALELVRFSARPGGSRLLPIAGEKLAARSLADPLADPVC